MNTLAAVSELLNGHWHNGDLGASISKGLAFRFRSDPNFPFLDSRNFY